jgi:hypothetical protein
MLVAPCMDQSVCINISLYIYIYILCQGVRRQLSEWSGWADCRYRTSGVCTAPPEDEKVMLETCRGS